MEQFKPKIQTDIDRDRIREIVKEALRIIHEYIEGEYSRTEDEILADMEKVLSNGSVATTFFLRIGSKKIPDLELRVDPRRREVLCRTYYIKKLKGINTFMRAL